MKNKYGQTMEQIKASEHFKEITLNNIMAEKKERRYHMTRIHKGLIGAAASLLLVVGVMNSPIFEGSALTPTSEINLVERIEVDDSGISACVVVNIEGVITEVSEDGLSFKMENGKWVHITDDTEIGITGPMAADPVDQFFEPTFRIGNMVAGFTEDENADIIDAYAIYTNWNWEDPIR